jgi:hypothetical protein
MIFLGEAGLGDSPFFLSDGDRGDLEPKSLPFKFLVYTVKDSPNYTIKRGVLVLELYPLGL